jgi:hypothetical protein
VAPKKSVGASQVNNLTILKNKSMIQIIIAVLMSIGVYATPTTINILSDKQTGNHEKVTFTDSDNNTTYMMIGTEEIGWGITSK